MNSSIKCPACGLQLKPDSLFCRHCGHRLEGASTPGETPAHELIERSANLKEPKKALDACAEYVERFPEDPVALDMKFTYSIITTFHTLVPFAANGQFPKLQADKDYELNAIAANLFSKGLPAILKNGIVTVARISDKGKRAQTFKFVQDAQKLIANQLIPLFEEAQRETESLLIEGKTRAVVEKKTMEDIYDDAEVYYRAYQEGDLKGALRGFIYLKNLNPMDAYFRNIIGSILSKQGKTRDALKEFLFGIHLDPGEPNLTSNVMRELTALALHPTAVEVWAHYRRHRQSDLSPDADRIVELLGNFATTLTAAIACATTGVGQDDFSPDEADILDEIIPPERPWLTEPQSSDQREKTFLDKIQVFISYRRADSSDMAQHLQQKMKTSYPSMSIFLDEAAMVGGEDFTDQIRAEIDKADVLLLLIGPYWHSPEGRKRLNETNDILRREIARALNKEVPIIPLLIENTKMPKAKQFPEELRSVAKVHAEQLRVDKLEADWGRLQKSMIRVITERKLQDKAIEGMSLDEWEKLMDAGKVQLPKYLLARSIRGEGLPYGQINLYGEWNCVKIAPDKRLSLRFVIEDRPDNLFTGELSIDDPNGRVIRTHKMRGDWASVLDVDSKPMLLLGLYLNFVLDDVTPMKLTIPFHQKVGDSIVGIDAEGIQYTSRNVEPRTGGF